MWLVVCFAVWPCDKLPYCPRWNHVFTLWQLGQAPVLSMTLYASKAAMEINEWCQKNALIVKHPLCKQKQRWIIPLTLWGQCTSLEPVVCQLPHCVLNVSAGVLKQYFCLIYSFCSYVTHTGSFPPSVTNREQHPLSGDVDVLQSSKQR